MIMKKLLFWSVAMLFSVMAFSQTVLYEDDFESYPTGSYIGVENPDWWGTWTPGDEGTPVDAMVVTTYAHSGTKSILIDETATHTGQTDLIWKLGDKVSGGYEVNFYIYIASGFSGYYNFQHFQDPGIEWAIQVHFKTTGDGELYAGQSDPYPFVFEHDQWIHLVHIINLDEDVAEMYIDGTLLHTWQWSLQSFGDPGTNQLGGIDFFAGANDGTQDTYYVDDVEYIQTAAPTDPAIEISPIFFNVSGTSGEIETRTLNIENVGYGDLNWEIFPIYELDAVRANGVNLKAEQVFTYKTLSHNQGPQVDPNAKPGGPSPETRDGVLRWDDGTNYSSIYWNSAPIDVKVGARFPAGTTTPFAGMELTSVEIFISDASATNCSVRIYGHGSATTPGTLIRTQNFTPVGTSWNTIVLSNPVLITGEDIWITYNFTQVDLVGTPGCDDGPQNPNGDYLSTGVGWGHLGAVGDPPFYPNWNIAGHLTGEPIAQWLYAEPASGTIVPGASTNVTISFDASQLPQGNYAGKLYVLSNDPENSQKYVPCGFNVAASPLVPPSNLTAATQCKDIVLNWEAPAGKAVLEGYNIYRDEVLINPDPVTETSYTDAELTEGSYSYIVKAVYDEGLSLSSNAVSASVEAIDPINQLEVSNEPGTPDVYLTWLPPGELPQWLHLDDGLNYDAIGLNNGGSFDVSALFSAEFLSDYEGMYITKIAFFPRGEMTGYAVKIWNSEGVLLEQSVTPSIENWNYVELNDPLMIDGAEALYVGYTCINQPVGEFPAGFDNGPVVTGGDLIRISGDWTTMGGLGYSLNWNIQFYVDWMAQPGNPVRPVHVEHYGNPVISQPVVGTLPQAQNATFNAAGRSLVGYNVWRNGEVINETPVMETSYADLGLANDTYEYCVTANYGTDCESAAVCGETSIVISVGMKEIDNALVKIYPNPANDNVNIMTTVQLKSIRMMSYTGQMIYNDQDVESNEIVKINTSSLEAGIYFIIVESNDGTYSKKVTIQ